MNNSLTFNENCERKLAELLFDDAYYTYEFDVTTGMIMKEIIGRNGYNYTEAVTKSTDCSFDEMVQSVLYSPGKNVEFTIDSGMQELSCKALLKAYEQGKCRVEVKLHTKQPFAYHRLTYLLDRDEDTDHVMAYVLCQDITDTENQWIRENASAKRELADALEETKKQKQLLQEALDNYKQADYDRRTDFLTGLRNRKDMYEFLQDNLSGKRDAINAMFMMDIDNFKLLNDHYGHVKGDECLKRIGEALTEYGKANNMYFYRYGGEEMLGISFVGSKTPDEIAQELVALVYDLKIHRDDMETGVVTVSIGYTTDCHSYEKMVDKADHAMYRAKSNGKNQAVCFEKTL